MLRRKSGKTSEKVSSGQKGVSLNIAGSLHRKVGACVVVISGVSLEWVGTKTSQPEFGSGTKRVPRVGSHHTSWGAMGVIGGY